MLILIEKIFLKSIYTLIDFKVYCKLLTNLGVPFTRKQAVPNIVRV